MLRISTVNLWVHDQDVALEFWTAKVGFELRSDATFVRFPDRYSDKRGVAMWSTVCRLLDTERRAAA